MVGASPPPLPANAVTPRGTSSLDACRPSASLQHMSARLMADRLRSPKKGDSRYPEPPHRDEAATSFWRWFLQVSE